MCKCLIYIFFENIMIFSYPACTYADWVECQRPKMRLCGWNSARVGDGDICGS